MSWFRVFHGKSRQFLQKNLDGLTPWIRSELVMIDYFNDSGKTSPNDHQIMIRRKIVFESPRWFHGDQISASNMSELCSSVVSLLNLSPWFSL